MSDDIDLAFALHQQILGKKFAFPCGCVAPRSTISSFKDLMKGLKIPRNFTVAGSVPKPPLVNPLVDAAVRMHRDMPFTLPDYAKEDARLTYELIKERDAPQYETPPVTISKNPSWMNLKADYKYLEMKIAKGLGLRKK